jgi:hypothetical protein
MLEYIPVVPGDPERMRYFKVGKDTGNENRKAVTVNTGSPFSPAPVGAAQLFQAFFVEFVLDVMVQEIPDVFAGFPGGIAFQVLSNAFCIVQVFPDYLFHQVNGFFHFAIFDDNPVLVIRHGKITVELAAVPDWPVT